MEFTIILQQKKKEQIISISLFEQAIFSNFRAPSLFLECYNFLRKYEHRYRKTPSKNVLKFLKHFSSRPIHKILFGPPCIICINFLFAVRIGSNQT